VRLVLAEINGKPKLLCHDAAENAAGRPSPPTVDPMQTISARKDLVTDVSWNFEIKKRIKAFKPRPPVRPRRTWRMQQADSRSRAGFRKCIECFLCQDVCHVLRDHTSTTSSSARVPRHAAALEMHPLDTEDRVPELKERRHRLLQHHQVLHEGLPEHITITDNAIIPLKERVVDRFYDPITGLRAVRR
jgi:succinate dehydrogenase / fumarate reductase iron-sulfur subunit